MTSRPHVNRTNSSSRCGRTPMRDSVPSAKPAASKPHWDRIKSPRPLMTKSSSPDELRQTMYGELRRLARRYLGRERKNHTLQPTALVHEAWLKLQNERGGPWHGRTHGLALGAQAMRRLLVDHGRHQKRQKRGGGAQPVALDDPLPAGATPGGPVA